MYSCLKLLKASLKKSGMNKEVNSVRFDAYSVGIIMNIFHIDILPLKYNGQLYSLR